MKNNKIQTVTRLVSVQSLYQMDMAGTDIDVIIKDNKNKEGTDELLSLYDSRKTIGMFYRLMSQNCYKILDKEFFYVRPSHEIRYGIKTIRSRIVQHIPLIREILITGTIFLIKSSKD